LPVRIKALPEGTITPVRSVLMTVENTDPKCFWLTNYLETLLVQCWYPCTVATQSLEIKKVIAKYLLKTGCTDMSQILFKLHDFGYRGSTSQESAAIGASAHLLNFMGTDTVAGIELILNYYNNQIGYMPGFSIPATEHSTITSWGREHEVDAYENMLKEYPKGTIACVSDSYNIYEACWKLWGTELKEQVLNRDGVLVIRPDSGNPPDVILKILNILGEYFGYSVNRAGYKVLNDKIRIIQGDGVNYQTIIDVYENITKAHSSVMGEGRYVGKWAAENISFGSGGALLQKMDRDTQKFAFKCSSITIAGEEHDVYKNPITDPGKISKKGRFKMVLVDGEWDVEPEWSVAKDELITVYENGNLCYNQNFEDIRIRVASGNHLNTASK
jgi:nicotinamide phosphoribosyltransferase